MRTYLVTFVVLITLSNALAASYSYDEYDEEAEDLKDKQKFADRSKSLVQQDKKESVEIYDLKDAPKLFEKFVQDYKRQYKNEEDYKKHYAAFLETLKEINRVNTSPTASHTSGINSFADFTAEEFAPLTGGIPDE